MTDPRVALLEYLRKVGAGAEPDVLHEALRWRGHRGADAAQYRLVGTMGRHLAAALKKRLTGVDAKKQTMTKAHYLTRSYPRCF